MKRRTTIGLLVSALLAALGLAIADRTIAGEDAKASSTEEKHDPSRGGRPDADSEKTGRITGEVILKGEIKSDADELKPLVIKKDHKDRHFCGAQIENEMLVVNDKKRIANAVVSLVKVKNAPRPRRREVTLDNVKCRFEPHVLATTRRSDLVIKTQDEGIFHSAHGYLSNEFNKAITTSKTELKVRGLRSGWTLVKCDGHDWMTAHLWVFDHDFFAISGKDGKFEIVGIPPGEYELQIWHERLALEPKKVKVEVEAGKKVEQDFELTYE